MMNLVLSRFSKNFLHNIKKSCILCRRTLFLQSLEFKNSKMKIDYNFICDNKNKDLIERVIKMKKSQANLSAVINMYRKINNSSLDTKEYNKKLLELEQEVVKIPNIVSPHLFSIGDSPKVIEYVNEKPEFNFKPRQLADIGEELHLLKGGSFGAIAQGRSYTYYLRDHLAELEQAFVKYTILKLKKCGFQLISVPEMVNTDVVEKCGFQIKGEYNAVFHVTNYDNVLMSGTGEMALSAYLQNQQFSIDDLPLKLMTVSRCFRPEETKTKADGKMYRVQEFTKVEMYGVTASETGDESQELYEEFVNIQKELFTPLGIHFQVLDMPLNDLGDSAYCKTDIEAWMPGKEMYGEISSTSNCCSYQSQRLNITYKDKNGQEKLVHTLNGTACAVPRLLIAVCESHQNEDLSINIPEILQPFMKTTKISMSSQPVFAKNKKKL